MGFEEEVENVPVPGQGIRRVKTLPLLSAIGFSGMYNLIHYCQLNNYFDNFYAINFKFPSIRGFVHGALLSLGKCARFQCARSGLHGKLLKKTHNPGFFRLNPSPSGF